MIDHLIIFGASGDLTARLLLPALAELVQEQALPADLRVLGASRDDWSADYFRVRMGRALAAHAPHVATHARNDLVARLDYRQADATDPAEIASLLAGGDRPILAYLALAPALFEPAVRALGTAGIPPGSAVAMKKPFGDSLASARHLNEVLRTELPDAPIFRVDHFLTNELISRIVAMRFANRIFEPIWNSEHVSHVEITWDETLTLEGRAAYYDRAGALRDMLQNHLLQVLFWSRWSRPRDSTTSRSAMPSCRPPGHSHSDAGPGPSHLVACAIWSGEHRRPRRAAYVDEPGIHPQRNTETFAELTLGVTNWRWLGTPFTIRSGKALARDRAEVAVHFRPVPDLVLEGFSVTDNVLRIGLIEPTVQLSVNNLGADHRLVEESFALDAGPPGRAAYANLLMAMLHGRQMVAIRADETEEMWRIVEPVLAAWARDDVPLLEYPAGSYGPTAGRNLGLDHPANVDLHR